jgi:integrase
MRGNITRRGKSSWRIRFDLPPGPDGKRRREHLTLRGGRRDAQAKLAELLAKIGSGMYVPASKLTIAQHVAARIEVWRSSGTIGDVTYERYQILASRQVIPHIGSMTLQDLDTAAVEAWHGKLRASGIAPRTARHAHALVRKSLGDATRHGLLAKNVCGRDGQPSPRVPAQEMTILEADERGAGVDKLRDHEIYPQALLALFGGLRAGEVLALRWTDLADGVLHVRGSVEEIAGEPLRLKSTKTKAGVRKVSLPDVVLDALRDHHRQQLEQRLLLGQGRPAADALMFPAADGGPRRRTILSATWGETAAALGIPGITFHSLRHCHASMLIAAKVDVVTVAARLGHSNARTTLGIYGHLYDRSDAAAAAAINAAFGTNLGPKKA